MQNYAIVINAVLKCIFCTALSFYDKLLFLYL